MSAHTLTQLLAPANTRRPPSVCLKTLNGWRWCTDQLQPPGPDPTAGYVAVWIYSGPTWLPGFATFWPGFDFYWSGPYYWPLPCPYHSVLPWQHWPTDQPCMSGGYYSMPVYSE
jgi:hypothetical protein